MMRQALQHLTHWWDRLERSPALIALCGTRRIEIIALAAAVLVILVPGAGLLLVPQKEAYEGRELAAFPSLGRLVDHASAGREEFADALVERVPIRPMAVRLQSSPAYAIFGYVNSPLVVSGRDGTLFFRESLRVFDCDQARQIEAGLAGFALVSAIAAGGDLPVLFSLSPSKASVYPAALDGVAGARYPCYQTRAGEARQSLADLSSGNFIDHTPRLLASASELPELYFRTDTHWRGYALAPVMEDLSAVFGAGYAVSGHAYGEAISVTEHTDLGQILQLGIFEDNHRLSNAEIEVIADEIAQADTDVRILHDSFYGKFALEFRTIFPQGHLYDYRAQSGLLAEAAGGIDQAGFLAALAGADLVLINVVERHFLSRFRDQGAGGFYAPDSAFGRFLIEANRARAEQVCQQADDRIAVGDAPHIQAVAGGGFELPIPFPGIQAGEVICFKLRLSGMEGARYSLSFIAADTGVGASASFSGQSPSDELEISLVLPASYAVDHAVLSVFGVAVEAVDVAAASANPL